MERIAISDRDLSRDPQPTNFTQLPTLPDANPYEPAELFGVFQSKLDQIDAAFYKEIRVVNFLQSKKINDLFTGIQEQFQTEVKNQREYYLRQVHALEVQNEKLQIQLQDQMSRNEDLFGKSSYANPHLHIRAPVRTVSRAKDSRQTIQNLLSSKIQSHFKNYNNRRKSKISVEQPKVDTLHSLNSLSGFVAAAGGGGDGQSKLLRFNSSDSISNLLDNPEAGNLISNLLQNPVQNLVDNDEEGPLTISPDVKLNDEQRSYIRKAARNMRYLGQRRSRSSDSQPSRFGEDCTDILGFTENQICITLQSVKKNLDRQVLPVLEELCYEFTRCVVSAQRNIELLNFQDMINLRKQFEEKRSRSSFDFKQFQQTMKEVGAAAALAKQKTVPTEEEVNTGYAIVEIQEEIDQITDLHKKVENRKLREINLKTIKIKALSLNPTKEPRTESPEDVKEKLDSKDSKDPQDPQEKLKQEQRMLHELKIRNPLTKLQHPDQLADVAMTDAQRIERLIAEKEEQAKEIEKLKQTIEQQRVMVAEAVEDKHKQHRVMCELRNNFVKDFMNLREQLTQSMNAVHQSAEDFEFISTSFMDLPETFDESTKLAWDCQKKLLEDNFNRVLFKSQKQQEEQRIKILKFERLCDEGNQFIKLNNMNADFLISRLVVVEEDPSKVWHSLEHHYGAGYFNPVIERVMGVTTDFKDLLFKEFNQKLHETTYENERQLNSLQKSLNLELTRLKDQNQQLQNDHTNIGSELNSKFRDRLEEVEQKMMNLYEAKQKNSLDLWQKRCKRLHDENNAHQNNIRLQSKSLADLNLQYAIQKWLYAIKMKKALKKVEDIPLFGTALTRDELRAICREHVTEVESFFKSRINDITYFIRNKQICSDVMIRNKKMREEWEDMELENQNLRLNANSYINKYNYSQMIIERQNTQLNDQATKILNLDTDLKTMKIDYQLMKGSSEFKDTYIDFIEKTQTTFLMKLKKLQKNHPSLAYFQRDPVATLEELRNRVHIKLARKGQEVVANVLAERKREKLSQTEMQGIHKIIEIHYNRKGELYAVKDQDKAIQAEPERRNKGSSMPCQEVSEKEVQTSSASQDVETIVRAIIALFRDFHMFYDDQVKSKFKQRQGRDAGLMSKEQFEFLLHVVRKNMCDLQGIPDVKQLLLRHDIQLLSMPDKYSTMTTKYNRLKMKVQPAIHLDIQGGEAPLNFEDLEDGMDDDVIPIEEEENMSKASNTTPKYQHIESYNYDRNISAGLTANAKATHESHFRHEKLVTHSSESDESITGGRRERSRSSAYSKRERAQFAPIPEYTDSIKKNIPKSKSLHPGSQTSSKSASASKHSSKISTQKKLRKGESSVPIKFRSQNSQGTDFQSRKLFEKAIKATNANKRKSVMHVEKVGLISSQSASRQAHQFDFGAHRQPKSKKRKRQSTVSKRRESLESQDANMSNESQEPMQISNDYELPQQRRSSAFYQSQKDTEGMVIVQGTDSSMLSVYKQANDPRYSNSSQKRKLMKSTSLPPEQPKFGPGQGINIIQSNVQGEDLLSGSGSREISTTQMRGHAWPNKPEVQNIEEEASDKYKTKIEDFSYLKPYLHKDGPDSQVQGEFLKPEEEKSMFGVKYASSSINEEPPSKEEFEPMQPAQLISATEPFSKNQSLQASTPNLVDIQNVCHRCQADMNLNDLVAATEKVKPPIDSFEEAMKKIDAVKEEEAKMSLEKRLIQDNERYQRIIEQLNQLIELKTPTQINIQPQYNLISSHIQVLEKSLQKRVCPLPRVDQITQTDFDGVFIGKINGEVEISKIKNFNEAAPSMHTTYTTGYLQKASSKDATRSFDYHTLKSSRRPFKRPERPNTAGGNTIGILKSRASAGVFRNMNADLQSDQPIEHSDRIQVKNFNQLIGRKKKNKKESVASSDAEYIESLAREIYQEHQQHEQLTKDRMQAQRNYNQRKLKELRSQLNEGGKKQHNINLGASNKNFFQRKPSSDNTTIQISSLRQQLTEKQPDDSTTLYQAKSVANIDINDHVVRQMEIEGDHTVRSSNQPNQVFHPRRTSPGLFSGTEKIMHTYSQVSVTNPKLKTMVGGELKQQSSGQQSIIQGSSIVIKPHKPITKAERRVILKNKMMSSSDDIPSANGLSRVTSSVFQGSQGPTAQNSDMQRVMSGNSRPEIAINVQSAKKDVMTAVFTNYGPQKKIRPKTGKLVSQLSKGRQQTLEQQNRFTMGPNSTNELEPDSADKYPKNSMFSLKKKIEEQ